MAFASQYIAPSSNRPIEEPALPIDDQVPPIISEEQEADLYYAVMKRMKAGQHEEAGIYLKKLLALKPDEPIYQEIKEQLDGIKRSYLLATKYISSGQLNLAESYVNDLLKVNPNDPMYLGLKEDLDEAKRQEELRRQEEARQLERKRRLEEARLIEERQRKDEMAEAQKQEQVIHGEKDINLTPWVFASMIVVLLFVGMSNWKSCEMTKPTESAIKSERESIVSKLREIKDKHVHLLKERDKLEDERRKSGFNETRQQELRQKLTEINQNLELLIREEKSLEERLLVLKEEEIESE